MPVSPFSNYCKLHKAKVCEIVSKHMVEKDEHLLNSLCILKEGAIVTAHVSQESYAAEHAFKIARNILV